MHRAAAPRAAVVHHELPKRRIGPNLQNDKHTGQTRLAFRESDLTHISALRRRDLCTDIPNCAMPKRKQACLVALLVLYSTTCLTAGSRVHDAVANGSAADIQAALDAGEDINAIGPGGQTPLMFAVLTGRVDAVRFLLEAGSDTSIGEKDGYTPMHGAGFQGRAEVAKLLIAHGLDPADRHSDGYTPLHRACWGMESRHTDTVRVLLEAGVPHDLPADNGSKPIDLASNNPKTRKLLKKWAKKAASDDDESVPDEL